MERYMIQYFLKVKLYYQNSGRLVASIRKVRLIIGRFSFPNSTTVKIKTKKFESTSSVVDLKYTTRAFSARAETNIEKV